MSREEEVYGAGPWTFSGDHIDAMAPGEVQRLDFFNMEYGGRIGFFRQYAPLSDLSVTNTNDSAPLSVSINDKATSLVHPNTSEPFASSEVMQVHLRNEAPSGGATIQSGEVTVEVSEGGVDADTQARDEAAQSIAEKALGDLVPGL